jgi:DNA-binding NtrC family response regulator
LLVDDEPMICRLGQTVLERQGYRVLLAEDGLEAVEIYQQEMGGIDLVILDLTMPRLSGLEALKRLKRLDPDVCVLLASGYNSEQLAQDREEDIAGFVEKPFRPDDLTKQARAALDQSRRTRRPNKGPNSSAAGQGTFVAALNN